MSKRNSIPKLRFRGFDDDWKNFKFPDIIIKSNQGVNTTTEKVEYSNSGYTVIRSNNIYENYISFNDVKYVDEQTFKKIKFTCKPQKGDILYCNIGSALGSAALYLLNEDVIINWNVFRIQPNLSIVDNFFLTQELNRIRKTMRRYATESTMPFISSKAFNFIKFNIPTLPEQQKIASFLSAVDEKIQQLSRKKELLEQYKKGVMQQLFSGKLKFKDENGKDYADWEEKKLGELVNNVGGTALEKYVNAEGKYKFISIGNYSVNGKYIDNNQRIDLNERTKVKLLNKNDLVMVLNDKTASGDLIGSSILIDSDDTFIYNQRSERLMCKQNVFPLFLWFYLNSFTFRKELFAISQGGTQIYVNFPSVKKLEIQIPSIREQQKIATFLSSIDAKIESTNQQMNQMQSFKKGLLQQLFV